MKTTQFAILVGMALAAIAYFAGFVALLITAIGGAVGWLVAMIITGRIDLRDLAGRAGDQR
ncbi:hypothetical protein [Naumannella halotolerans]|nr:hypothetical protein [Naumannella halotolerans]